MSNPYKSPDAQLVDSTIDKSFSYVGFGPRLLASVIDSILMMLIIFPILFQIYGEGYLLDEQAQSSALSLLLQLVFPAIAVIVFWVYRSATPGKMAIKAVIVDAKTLQPASKGQLIVRYLGYYLSSLTLFLGFLWIVFNNKKQGLHDIISGTVVIRYTNQGEEQ